MIHEEICTYEVAKLAKEKGFPQHIGDDAYIVENEYDDEYEVGCHYPIPFIPDYLPTIAAPTQSLLQRWLREKKEVFVEVHTRPHFATTHTKTFYVWNIQYCDCKQAYRMLQDPQDAFYSYEEALEDALKYSLENLV